MEIYSDREENLLWKLRRILSSRFWDIELGLSYLKFSCEAVWVRQLAPLNHGPNFIVESSHHPTLQGTEWLQHACRSLVQDQESGGITCIRSHNGLHTKLVAALSNPRSFVFFFFCWKFKKKSWLSPQNCGNQGWQTTFFFSQPYCHCVKRVFFTNDQHYRNKHKQQQNNSERLKTYMIASCVDFLGVKQVPIPGRKKGTSTSECVHWRGGEDMEIKNTFV